mmetsp:Transcript_30445/g.59475  ORF Transcript_30445/g.59475 Transcript_30445/m.59475 type:complete len:116 (+) Transcript_30445:108-455(+)
MPGCGKWADCKCALHGDSCDCGDGCGCGSITHEAMEAFKKGACPWSDCKCGGTCGCGPTCACGGTTPKTDAQWATACKGATAAAGDCPWSDCSCKAANNGVCKCGAGCKCGTTPK